MVKFFGSDNDLISSDGAITKTGYITMAFSSVFGFCLFLIGRMLYGNAIRKKSEKRKSHYNLMEYDIAKEI